MKKHMMLLFAFALASGTARGQDWNAGQFSVLLKVPLESKALTGAPYSAEIVSDHTQSLADGNRIVQHTTGRVYRDSEGRVRREEDRPSGTPGISITDPVAGVSYSLDPETHVAWKTPSMAGTTIMGKLDAAKMKKMDEAKMEAMKVEEARRRAQEAAQGLREFAWTNADGNTAVTVMSGGRVELKREGAEQRSLETLPSRVIEGVRVEGKRSTTTIPAGAIGNEWAITIVSDEWTSPELQVLVLTERRDPREGDATYKLVHVVRTEPAAALFQVPADYTIRETGIRKFERQQ